MDLKALLAASEDGTTILMRRREWRDAPKAVRQTWILGFCSRRMGEHIRTNLDTPALISAFEDGYTAAIEAEHLDLVATANTLLADVAEAQRGASHA